MFLINSDSGLEAGEDRVFATGHSWSGSDLKRGARATGRLTLPDESFLEGDFGLRGDFDGEFRHFSGVAFRGKFLAGKMLRGEVDFGDGDVLEAEFRAEGKLWVASKAFLNSNGCRAPLSLNSATQLGAKTIHPRYKDVGFAVVWAAPPSPACSGVRDLLLSPCGYYEYQRAEGGTVTRHRLNRLLLFPCEEVERALPGGQKATVTVHPLGLAIRPTGPDACVATFRNFDRLLFKGAHHLSEFKFKLKGDLFLSADGSQKKFAKLCIKKSVESDLCIRLDEREVCSMSELNALLAARVGRPAVPRPSPNPKPSSPALQNIIKDIKKENQCNIA